MHAISSLKLWAPMRGGHRTIDLACVGRILCLCGAALGAAGLLGWLTGAMFLTTLASGLPAMMPSTAVGLILLGVGGALQTEEVRPSARIMLLSGLGALIVLAIGAVSLAEYAFGINLVIDQLLVPAHGARHLAHSAPPAAALALTFLAGALLLVDFRPTARVRPSEWLILSAGLIALVAFVGHSFGPSPLVQFHTPPVNIELALPTAGSILLIGFGLLLARPNGGLMRVATSPGPGGVLVRRLVPVTMVGPIVLVHVVLWLFAALGADHLSLPAATLAAAMSMAGVLLLTVTAAPLNRSHQALEASRARSRDLIEQAPDGIFIADSSGVCTNANTAGCRMLGCRPEDIVGKNLADLIRPEERLRFLDSKQQLLGGEIHVAEWSLRRADGTYLPVEVSARMLADGRWQTFVRDISVRKRTQDELRQSQERFELALRGADLAAWDWNIKTGVCVFSPRWAEMRGLDPKEVPACIDAWLSGVHPDDLPRLRASLANYFDGRAPEYESEHRVLTASGDWIWVLDRGKVFTRDESGRPIRMVGTELDISARRRLEEELRFSEAKASGILSISADAIISVDEGHRITLFNEGASKIFGYSKSEALGASVEMLMPERYRSFHRQYMEAFAAGEEVARRMGEQACIAGLRKDGEEFPLDGTISKLDLNGKRIFTVAFRDVSEQRRTQKEQKFLAEVGAVLANTLDYEETIANIANLAVRDLADLCVVEVVEDGVVRRIRVSVRDQEKGVAAKRLERVQLDPRCPHLGSRVFETKQPLLVREITPEYLESVAQSDSHLRALRETGPESLIACPLMAHGRLVGVMILISTTAARRYGPQDLSLSGELAERAALAVDNAQLYRTARRAVAARDELLAIVAHDLRNPLNTILMHASLLEHERRSQRAADAIRRSVMRMNRLIQDLLDIARMEAGHLSVEPVAVSTERIIVDSIETQSPLASALSLELQTDIAQPLPEVLADRDRLLQIFENLIGNALKFTKPGGRITVGAAPRDGAVMFWVADTGEGVAGEDVPHLFDRFWQAQKDGRLGAGLGLPIVKGLVEAHGGTIWAESAPGHGSTFFFTIPTAPSVRPRPAEYAPGRNGEERVVVAAAADATFGGR